MPEDAAQDAFVTAWMKLNTLQDPKKYGSWMCRIAKNCALNMISRYRSFLPLGVVDNLNITDDGAENPSELYALSEERDEVNKGVARLPEKVRQIIHLHYFDDLSTGEIADRCVFQKERSKDSFTMAEGASERSFAINNGKAAENEKFSAAFPD